MEEEHKVLEERANVNTLIIKKLSKGEKELR
jgi:hypothetical protein